MKYETGSKLEKHQVYVASLKNEIKFLENQKAEIEKELVELGVKLSENEDYVPEEWTAKLSVTLKVTAQIILIVA